MIQYFLSPVIGTGTETDPIRLKAQDQMVGNISVIIPSSPTTGLPLFAWGLCIVNSGNVAGIVADATNHPIPQITLDAKWTTVAVGTRNQVTSAMTTLGISTGFINAQTSLRDIINTIGRHLDPKFDANRFSA